MSEQVAVYARVSSEQQAHEGTIDSQIESVKEYVERQGYQLAADAIFVDNGISGSTLVRPALDALRDRAARGDIERIFILCPDRLARKYAHQLLVVEEFQRLGVPVEFTNNTFSDFPEDQLLVQMQGVIAEFEREKILERSRRGKLHKAKTGHVSVLAGAPYGYVYIRRTEAEDARYEIHPEEAAVVRRIFQMLTLERMSMRAIARQRNADAIPTRRRQGIWESSTVGGILHNPAYMGQAAYRKTQVVARTRVTKLARDHGLYPKQLHSSSRERAKADWIYIPVPQLVSENMFRKVEHQADLRAKKAKEARQQEVEKQRLLDLYQVGTLSLDEIQDRLQGIRAKLKTIAEEQTWLEAEAQREHQQLQLIEPFSDFTHNITKRLDQLTFADKKQILRLLVKEVVVDTAKEEMTIHHIVPLDKSCSLRPWSACPALQGASAPFVC